MRRFEFKEGSSNKFWEVTVSGNTLTVGFGRVVVRGKENRKPFALFRNLPASAACYFNSRTSMSPLRPLTSVSICSLRRRKTKSTLACPTCRLSIRSSLSALGNHG